MTIRDKSRNIFTYLWRRKGLITSGVTLFATLASGAFWVNGYFAKDQTLKLHYCETQAALADVKLATEISQEETAIEMSEHAIKMFQVFGEVEEDNELVVYWKNVRDEHRDRLVKLAKRDRAWTPQTIKSCMSQDAPHLDPTSSVNPINFD